MILESKTKADLTDAHSLLSARGDVQSLHHVPDPRYALRELRTTEVPTEKITQALEQQAFLLGQIVQLLPLLKLRAVLATPEHLGDTHKSYKRPGRQNVQR